MNLKRLAILEAFLKLFDRDVDAYWLAKGFFQFSTKLTDGFSKFRDLLRAKLEAEDPSLYR